MVDCVPKSSCFGCKACGDICPVQAISFPIDSEGFWYPLIDTDKCIKCNLCEKVCPALNVHNTSGYIEGNPETYKVYHKDKDIRYNSTSGALYYSLAEEFVKNKDYIVGCVYNDAYTGAHHEASNSLEGLKRIMRSKYFQSDTEGIFNKTKSLLEKGEKVLFCGTGCQISALNGFLRKEYENLYTIELICRGVNSPLAFTSYMEELRKRFKSEIKEVHFKNKSHGWTNLGTLIKFENGKSYYRNRFNDPWVNAFIVGNLYIRPSCEHCKYKSFPRVADITIGDFWGIEFNNEEKKYGVSVAFVNTEKGQKLFRLAEKNMYVEKRKFEEAVKGNPALLNPIKLNSKRTVFFDRIKKEPYSKVVWELLDSNALKRTKNFVILKTRQCLSAVLRKIHIK